MRVIFIIILGFSLLAGACSSQGKTNKTKISQKYHKKEYPKNQANINSLHYSKNAKKKQKQPGFFKRLFSGNKNYYANNWTGLKKIIIFTSEWTRLPR